MGKDTAIPRTLQNVRAVSMYIPAAISAAEKELINKAYGSTFKQLMKKLQFFSHSIHLHNDKITNCNRLSKPDNEIKLMIIHQGSQIVRIIKNFGSFVSSQTRVVNKSNPRPFHISREKGSVMVNDIYVER
ncbi:hypothetical protein Syun_000993 [Stephania yunnanensis]|uniref:Uncharacterized protein n=1 Tax=Stephania yunnanensis TaxID=152371 RepID=A0AAP0LCY3_9MAGN